MLYVIKKHCPEED